MTRAGRRARLAAVGLAVAATALGACGTPAADVAIAPPPSPNPYVAAVVITESWASALVDIDYRATVDGVTTAGTGAGQVGLATGRGRLEWTGPDGTTAELVNDRGLFVRGSDGTWQRRDDPTATSGLVDVLAGLGSASSGPAEPATEPEGAERTRFEADVPVDAGSLAAFPLDEPARARVLADPGATITATAWVNGNGQITRIERRLAAGAVTAETVVRLSEFGGMLDLESPTTPPA